VDEGRVYPRATTSYEARYDRFILHSKNYHQQYNQIYINRLNLMKSHMRYGTIKIYLRW
jgi:hypothetical protein